MYLVDFVDVCRFLMILGSLIENCTQNSTLGLGIIPELSRNYSGGAVSGPRPGTSLPARNLPLGARNLPLGARNLPLEVVSLSAVPTLPSTHTGGQDDES